MVLNGIFVGGESRGNQLTLVHQLNIKDAKITNLTATLDYS